jgi:hypothetical protein
MQALSNALVKCAAGSLLSLGLHSFKHLESKSAPLCRNTQLTGLANTVFLSRNLTNGTLIDSNRCFESNQLQPSHTLLYNHTSRTKSLALLMEPGWCIQCFLHAAAAVLACCSSTPTATT